MRVVEVEQLLDLFGASVTGVDIAASALEAARGRTEGVEFREVDFLREGVPGGPFELVYDSGCFHHLAPHRRISYLKSLREVLAPGGYFGICTFTAGRMGSTEPDDVLHAGLPHCRPIPQPR